MGALARLYESRRRSDRRIQWIFTQLIIGFSTSYSWPRTTKAEYSEIRPRVLILKPQLMRRLPEVAARLAAKDKRPMENGENEEYFPPLSENFIPMQPSTSACTDLVPSSFGHRATLGVLVRLRSPVRLPLLTRWKRFFRTCWTGSSVDMHQNLREQFFSRYT